LEGKKEGVPILCERWAKRKKARRRNSFSSFRAKERGKREVTSLAIDYEKGKKRGIGNPTDEVALQGKERNHLTLEEEGNERRVITVSQSKIQIPLFGRNIFPDISAEGGGGGNKVGLCYIDISHKEKKKRGTERAR